MDIASTHGRSIDGSSGKAEAGPPPTPSPAAGAADASPVGGDWTGRRVHFVGVGGCGMSGLAAITRDRGAVCTGSDRQPSELTDWLARQGVRVAFEQSAATVPERLDLLVASAAIPPDHPELAEARDRGVPVLKYAEMLGRLMTRSHGVAVAGTHGKSTTTAMLCHCLLHGGLDPSFVLGARCAQIGGGARSGGSGPGGDLLVAEACEYDRSFHHLHPRAAAILNMEEDHMEIYQSLDALVEAFRLFAQRVQSAAGRDGFVLLQHEAAHRMRVIAGLDCRVETIGFAPQADWRVTVSPPASPGGEAGAPPRGVVELAHFGEPVARWRAALPGEHMAYNAAVAAAMAHQHGVDWPMIEQALEGFEGLDRRMQPLGEIAVDGGAAWLVDDYGHHPTEIDTTLRALRRWRNPRRLICVFQPHQHSRTRFLMEQFARSFSQADLVVVPQIYFVRDAEAMKQQVTASHLVERLRRQGVTAMHIDPMDAIADWLRTALRPGDLVVTMGAGDVWKVARRLRD